MEKKQENQMAMFCHLIAFAGVLIPFGNLIGPLILWILKKEESPFIDHHGKESLNFQITVTIAMIIAGLLALVLIGLLLIPIIAIGSIILIIMATLAAQKGEEYRYPVSIRFIK